MREARRAPPARRPNGRSTGPFALLIAAFAIPRVLCYHEANQRLAALHADRTGTQGAPSLLTVFRGPRPGAQKKAMPLPPPFPPISSVTASTRDFARARFLIEDVYPSIEQGRYPVKRIQGEPIEVWADIFRDGHEVIAAALVWRREGEKGWDRSAMRLHENDRWTGSFVPHDPGRYVYAIEAWTDAFASWRRDFLLKREAGQNLDLEAKEGRELLADVAPKDKRARATIESARAEFDRTGNADVLLSEALRAVMADQQPRPDLTRSAGFPLVIDPLLARAGAWYEMFPRSQSAIAGQHGTFDDCIARLPELAALGFDVIYLPPIHPIGRIHRKGAANALVAG